MSSSLNLKIKEELIKDFHPLEQELDAAFTNAGAFLEMAKDYYKCKKMICFYESKNNQALVNDYEELRKDLQQDIKDYLSKE